MSENVFRHLYETTWLKLQEAERHILYLEDCVQAADTGVNREGYDVNQQLMAVRRHSANRGLYKIQHAHLDE